MITKIDEMVKTGVHFGHQAKKWNPKMAPYIYAEKNGIHIIDLIQTYFFLKNIVNFLTSEAAHDIHRHVHKTFFKDVIQP